MSLVIIGNFKKFVLGFVIFLFFNFCCNMIIVLLLRGLLKERLYMLFLKLWENILNWILLFLFFF